MKTNTRQFATTVGRTGREWALTRAVIDPLLVVACFVVVFAMTGERLREIDLMLVGFAFLLLYPSKLPFVRFTLDDVASIAVNWAAVVLLWLGFELAREHLLRVNSKIFEIDAIVIWAVGAPIVLTTVHLVSPHIAPYLRTMYKQCRAVVVGVNEVAHRFTKLVDSGEAEGQRIVAYFDDRKVHRGGKEIAYPVMGGVDAVVPYVKQNGIDSIYICLPMTSQPRILALLEQLRDTTASIHFLPDIFVADLIQARVDVVGGMPVVAVCDTPFHGTPGVLKRILDVTLVGASLPLALPLMLIVAAAIRFTSPGPVIFKQKRYGLDGKPIVVWKFRTMKTLEDGDKTYRQVTRDDDRVTPIGRILRKTSLDELPQLINVLIGNMSLVGPRPHALAVNEAYRKLIPGYMVRHKVKPGITGWAQVNGCRGGDDLDSMRKRTEFDLAYLRSWSITFDLLIIWKTVVMLLVGDRKAY